MARHRRRHLAYALVAAIGAVGTVVATAGVGTASTSSATPKLVTDPAALVNPFIGTSGAVDTFPGPDMPFGMMQWSPDTSPDRPSGGGYEYNDSKLQGFSLTHVSGPGCGAYGDVPILPTVGAIGTTPGSATASFSHSAESASAGYYGVTLGNGVGVKLTDATHSGIGQFDFPASTQANLLLKLSDSADQVDGTSASVVGDDEVTGSVTAGHFCGAPTSWERDYTLHFDIQFSQPFTASGTWGGTSSGAVTPDARSLVQHATSHSVKSATPRPVPDSRTVFSGAKPDFTPRPAPSPRVHAPATATQQSVSQPGGVYLTFDTTRQQTVTARVGISFTSDANAKLNLGSEIKGWNFGAVQQQNVAAWNRTLNKVQIAGGSHTQQVEFYTGVYHALLHPNVFSDVNGQYMGFDGKVHQAASGHAEYANYSGWDIYRSQVQLAAMLEPQVTSDSVTSMLNQYEQTGELPKWALANGESYVMVGDPADSIIADAYAFGARDFNTTEALKAMIAEATSTNNVRPGEAQEAKYGYLPYDQTYGCCNFYGSVSTQLEYDVADHAIATFAQALGDSTDYTKFATMANDWQNVFNPATGYLQARLTSGQFVPGFTPATNVGFVEGTSAQYTPMVNFNLQGIVDAKGGDEAYNSYLDGLLSNLTKPTGDNADLSNEPSVEIPWEYDYTGEPYKAQAVLRQAQQQLFFDAPVGQDGNDDLGEMSAWFTWSQLGLYPEVPGMSTLVVGSPVFPESVIHLASGRTITVEAPKAAADTPYVQSLSVDGKSYAKDYLDFGDLTRGATLDFDLGSTANTSWAASPQDEPPSDSTGERPALASATPGNGLVLAPGSSGSGAVSVANVSGSPVSVTWTAATSSGISVSPTSGSLTVPAHSSVNGPVNVTAGTTEGAYAVTFTVKANGATLPTAQLAVDVAKPGELWPYYDNSGVGEDGQANSADFDGDGFSYSAQQLSAQGLTPGTTVSSDGLTYTWPNVQPNQPDNITAGGQKIPVTLPSGATRIGLLGSATNAGASGAQGTLTVTYTDGSTQQIPVAMSDWTLGANTYTPVPGDHTVVTTAYRDDTSGGQQVISTYLFAVDAQLTAGKTVASITLPTTTGGTLHVFAIGSA